MYLVLYDYTLTLLVLIIDECAFVLMVFRSFTPGFHFRFVGIHILWNDKAVKDTNHHSEMSSSVADVD